MDLSKFNIHFEKQGHLVHINHGYIDYGKINSLSQDRLSHFVCADDIHSGIELRYWALSFLNNLIHLS